MAIGFGLIVPPNSSGSSDVLKPTFGEGMILPSIAAVALNAFFGQTTRKRAEAGSLNAALAAEQTCPNDG